MTLLLIWKVIFIWLLFIPMVEHVVHISKLEKGFQKKTIVALTNNTVFILDFYIYINITMPVWSHVSALSARILNKAHYSQLPGSLSPDYKYLHARQIPHQLSFPSQTIPDCIRYVIGVFCYYFKSQTNILASY